jgi:predicted Zn-dependent peptidase
VLNLALGGGMSSRLFQEIRERRGKAYTVYSFLASYLDAGYAASTSDERGVGPRGGRR